MTPDEAARLAQPLLGPLAILAVLLGLCILAYVLEETETGRRVMDRLMRWVER